MKEIIVLLIVTVLCYVACQKSYFGDPEPAKAVPEKCRMNNLMYRQCCVFPPFFISEVARECGARFKINAVYDDSEIAILRREVDKRCDYWKCIFEKYDFVVSDEFIDEEKYFSHLDRWVDLNQNFADVILNAKIYCKTHFRPVLPMKQCEFQEFNMCIRNFANVNCPVVLSTKECNEWKVFYEECHEYYI